MRELSPRSLELALKANSLAEHQDLRVLCALSGGLDSMVLLHLAHMADVHVRAIHIDHGVHSDSAHWAGWVKQQCAKREVPVEVHRIGSPPEGCSLEEYWRDARRDWFSKAAHRGEFVITAHHQDDQVETFFLQLMRGAGPTGLQGMPELQQLPGGAMQFRPLLAFSRQQLLDYAQREGIEWLEDPSNSDERFDRNFLRHTVLPVFARRWPSVPDAVTRSMALMADAAALNEDFAAQDVKTADDGLSLDWSLIATLDRPRQANAIRFWLRQLGIRLPPRRRLDEALRQWCEASTDRLPVLKLDQGQVQKYRSRLVFDPNRGEIPSNWSKQLVPGEWVALPGGYGEIGLDDSSSAQENEASESVRLSIVMPAQTQTDLSIRFRRGGERLRRAAGHHQSLKHWFQQNDVPPIRRSSLPLIYLGEELIAIAGFWVDARFRPDQNADPAQKVCYLVSRAKASEEAK